MWGRLAGNRGTRPAVFVYDIAMARGKGTEKHLVYVSLAVVICLIHKQNVQPALTVR